MLERPAHQREALELPLRGGDQPRVPVAEVQRGVRGEHVQVAAALDIGHPGALGLGGDDRQRMVVVCAVLVAELEQAGRGLGHEPRVWAI